MAKKKNGLLYKTGVSRPLVDMGSGSEHKTYTETVRDNQNDRLAAIEQMRSRQERRNKNRQEFQLAIELAKSNGAGKDMVTQKPQVSSSKQVMGGLGTTFDATKQGTNTAANGANISYSTEATTQKKGWRGLTGLREWANDGEREITSQESKTHAEETLKGLSSNQKKLLDDYVSAKDLSTTMSLSMGNLYGAPVGVGEFSSTELAKKREQAKKQFMEETGVDEATFDKYIENYSWLSHYNAAQTQAKEIRDSSAVEKGIGTVLDVAMANIPSIYALGGNTKPNDPELGRDQHTPYAALKDATRQTEEAVNEDIQEIENKALRTVAHYGYNAAVAAGKSAVSLAAGAGIAGAMGLEGEAAKGVINLVTLPTFGASAYESTIEEAQERGLTTRQATSVALIAGTAEMATEVFSLDSLWEIAQKSGNKVAKQALVDVLAQSAIEGSEEVASDIINEAADRIVNGDKSTYYQSVEYYQSKQYCDDTGALSPMTEDEAKKAATKDFLNEIKEDGILGALSGGMSAGTVTAINAGLNTKAGREIARDEAFVNTVLNDTESEEYISPNRDDYDSLEDYNQAQKTRADLEAANQTSKIKGKDARNLIKEIAKTYENKSNSAAIESSNEDEYKIEKKTNEKALEAIEYASTPYKLARAIEEVSEETEEIKEAIDFKRQDMEMYGFKAEDVDTIVTPKKAYEMGVRGEAVTEEQLSRIPEQDRLEVLEANNQAFNKTVLKEHKDAIRDRLSGRYFVPKKVEVQGSEVVIKDSEGNIHTDFDNPKINATNSVINQVSHNAITGRLTNESKYNVTVQQAAYATQMAIKSQDATSALIATATQRILDAASIGNTTWSQFEKKSNGLFTTIDSESAEKLFNAVREASLKSDSMKASSSTVKKEGKITDKAKESLETQSDALAALTEAFAKKIGVDVKAFTLNNENRGQYVPEKGEIKINTTHADEAWATLMHEGIGEFLQRYNAKDMRDIQNNILDYLESTLGSMEYNNLIDAYQSAYRTGAKQGSVDFNKTRREAANEMVNDTLFGLFSTEEGLADFTSWVTNTKTSTEQVSILSKVKDFFDSLVRYIKDLIDTGSFNAAEIAMLNMQQDKAEILRSQVIHALNQAIANRDAEGNSISSEDHERSISAYINKKDTFSEVAVSNDPSRYVQDELQPNASFVNLSLPSRAENATATSGDNSEFTSTDIVDKGRSSKYVDTTDINDILIKHKKNIDINDSKYKEYADRIINNQGQLPNEKYNMIALDALSEDYVALIKHVSGGRIDLTGKHISLEGGKIYHELISHQNEDKAKSLHQKTYNQSNLGEFIKAIYEPDYVEYVSAGDARDNRQTYAVEKDVNGHHVAVLAVGGNRNKSVTPEMMIIFADEKWNEFLQSGNTLGQLMYENDHNRNLTKDEIEFSKKNRVTAVRYESDDSSAFTSETVLRSPLVNNILTSEGGNATATSSDNSEFTSTDIVDKGRNSKKIADVDVEGRNLTEAQQEYFKDSKVIDDQGRLKTILHGTQEEFYVFNPREKGGKNGIAEGYGIYFAENPEITQVYGDVQLEGYLNITKPAYSDKTTIKASQLAKLIEQTCKDEAKELLEDGGYDSLSEAIKDTWVSNVSYTYDKTMKQAYKEAAEYYINASSGDMEIIQGIMRDIGIRSFDDAYDFYDKLKNIMGYDGFITEWESPNGDTNTIYVAFDSNQFKKVDNLNPTANDDIRKSIKVDTSGKKYVDIEEDIIAGISDDKQRKEYVKEYLRTYYPTIDMLGFDLPVIAKSRNEFINSKYTKMIRNELHDLFVDKMRIAGNLEEVVSAAEGYSWEAVKKSRKDKALGFIHGKIQIRVGQNDYIADVVLENLPKIGLIFYDIVDMQSTAIKAVGTSPMVSKANTVNTPTASKNILSSEQQKTSTTSSEGNVRKSIDVDTQGREIGAAMQQYLKDNSAEFFEDGKVKNYYHGTRYAGFTKFDLDRMDDNQSIFLTDSKTVAKTYAGNSDMFEPDRTWSFNELESAISYVTGGDWEIESAGNKVIITELGFVDQDDKVTEFDSIKEAQTYFIDNFFGNTDLISGGENGALYNLYVKSSNPYVIDADNNYWNEIPPKEYAKHYKDVTILVNDDVYDVDYSDEKGHYHHATFNSKEEFNKTFGKLTYVVENEPEYDFEDIYFDENGDMVPSNTRDLAKLAKEQGYDSLVVNNVIDTGIFANTDERTTPAQVVVVFDPSNVKSVYNADPTSDADIRKSIKLDWDEKDSFTIPARNYSTDFFDLNDEELDAAELQDIRVKAYIANIIHSKDFAGFMYSYRENGHTKTRFLTRSTRKGYDYQFSYMDDNVPIMHSNIKDENDNVTNYSNAQDMANFYSEVANDIPMKGVKVHVVRTGIAEDARNSFKVYGEASPYADSINETRVIATMIGSMSNALSKADAFTISNDEIIRIERDIANKYKTNLEEGAIAANVSYAFAHMQRNKLDTDYEGMMNYLLNIGDEIIKNSNLKDPDSEQLYKETKSVISKYKFKLSDAERAEISNAFGGSWKTAFGALNKAGIKLDNKNGFSVDELFGQIREDILKTAGVDLTYADKPSEQILAILDLMNALEPTVYLWDGANDMDKALTVVADIVEEYYKVATEQLEKNVVKGTDKGKQTVKAAVDKEKARLRGEWSKYKNTKVEEFNATLAEKNQIIQQQQNQIRKQEDELKTWNKNKTEQDRLNEKEKRLTEKQMQKTARIQAQQAVQSYKDRQERAKQIENIKRTGIRLIKWLDNPSDAEHVPPFLQKPLAEFLSAIDFLPKNAKADSKNTLSWQQRMNSLRDAIKRIDDAERDGENNAEAYFAQNIVARELLAMMDDFLGKETWDEATQSYIVTKRAAAQVSKLDAKELQTLNKIMSALSASINNMNKTYANNVFKKISQVSKASVKEIDNLPEKKDMQKAIGKVFNFLNFDELEPITYFEGLGAGAKSIYDELRDGFNIKTRHVRASDEYMADVKKELGITDKELSTWKNQVHVFDLVEGKVMLNTTEIMSLYEILKRKQGRPHVAVGGIKAADFEYKDGKVMKKHHQAKAIHIMSSEAQAIIDTLTDEQKALADKMQQYMASECASWGNRVTEKMFGYKKYEEKDYFPLKTDSHTRATTASSDNNVSYYTIKNASFTKAITPMANNAVMLNDIFDVFTDHVVQMAEYDAYVMPIADAMRWFNFSEKMLNAIEPDEFNESGQRVDYIGNMQESIDRVYGDAGLSFFKQFIKDINGDYAGAGGKSEILSSMMSLYKAQAVGANIRVVVQQPTAIVRAADVIEPKYLTKAMAVNPVEYAKKAQANSEIAYWKAQGYYETYLGQSFKEIITGDTTVKDRINDAAGYLAGKADDISWGVMYRAAELKVKDTMPNLKEGTEAFNKATVKIFEDIIDHTQVVDTLFHKSQWMRSQELGHKITSAFMAEPTKTYNMLYRAFRDAKLSDNKSIARRRLNKVAKIFVIEQLLNAIVTALIDSLRDDEKESYLAGVKEAFLENALDNFIVINMIPIAKDILSFIQGYDATSYIYDGLESLVQTLVADKKYVTNLITGNSQSKTVYGIIYQNARALSQLTGIPVSNIMRDMKSIYNTVNNLWDGEDLFTTTSTKKSVEKKHQKNSFAEAYESGDLNQIKSAMNTLYNKSISNGSDESEAWSYVKSVLKEEYISQIKEHPEDVTSINNRFVQLVTYTKHKQNGEYVSYTSEQAKKQYIDKWYESIK